VIFVVLAGCAMHVELPPAHPARSMAPTGRLAGAPPALRPGVVQYSDVPELRSAPEPVHHHHHDK
jgi:hypothetical protein